MRLIANSMFNKNAIYSTQNICYIITSAHLQVSSECIHARTHMQLILVLISLVFYVDFVILRSLAHRTMCLCAYICPAIPPSVQADEGHYGRNWGCPYSQKI